MTLKYFNKDGGKEVSKQQFEDLQESGDIYEVLGEKTTDKNGVEIFTKYFRYIAPEEKAEQQRLKARAEINKQIAALKQQLAELDIISLRCLEGRPPRRKDNPLEYVTHTEVVDEKEKLADEICNLERGSQL